MRAAGHPVQPEVLPTDETWLKVRDGNRSGLAIYNRHYSAYKYRDGRNPVQFVGPGEHIVLLTPAADALFVWRKFICAGGQNGINCSVFRNEGPRLSSELILEAERWAVERWGLERMYTFVNPSKVRSTNPGFCFLKAGWQKCGITKTRKLLILEKFPNG